MRTNYLIIMYKCIINLAFDLTAEITLLYLDIHLVVVPYKRKQTGNSVIRNVFIKKCCDIM